MWKVPLYQLCSFCVFVLAQQNFIENGGELDSDSENSTPDALDPEDSIVTPCQTPNNETGYCMPIQMCSKLLNQLNNTTAQTFLRESRCGSKHENRSNPMVCCGKDANYEVFPKECGRQNVTLRDRIFGGTEAEIGEFPWLARLNTRSKDRYTQFGCTGFLISDQFVVTAAHCIKNENTDNFGPLHYVVLGEHNTNTRIDCQSENTTCAPKTQSIIIKHTLMHPLYNSSSRHHHHDIGLIQLRKPVNITEFVRPICLMKQHHYHPFEYWLSGWGTTETEVTSNIKLKLSVPPFPHKKCTREYKKIQVQIGKKQLCAGGQENKDSCTGDSGGPLMVVENEDQWFAAGVVSFGLECGREGWPGVYTNITSYYNWIEYWMVKLQMANVTRKAKTKNGTS